MAVVEGPAGNAHWTVSAGMFTAEAEVDSGQVIEETNESNNFCSVTRAARPR